MPDFSRNEQTVVNYLLGNLPQAETEHLDELSVADDEFADFLEEVECDLIDDYVRKELSQENRARFESHFLASPERRKRVEVARMILRYVDSTKGTKLSSAIDPHKMSAQFPDRPRDLQWGAIAAVLLISLIGAYSFFKNNQLQKQIAAMKEEHAVLQQHEEQLRKDLAQQRSLDRQKQNDLMATREKLQELEKQLADHGGVPQQLFAFSLSPQHREFASIPTMKVPVSAESVVVTLKLESDDFPLYQAVLKNSATNETLWRGHQEKSSQNAVVVRLPANLLRSQDYTLELFGVSNNGKTEIISGYPFQVSVQ